MAPTMPPISNSVDKSALSSALSVAGAIEIGKSIRQKNQLLNLNLVACNEAFFCCRSLKSPFKSTLKFNSLILTRGLNVQRQPVEECVADQFGEK